MTGAPRDLYASRDFIVIHLGMVDEVGWEAAAVFQRIAYRSERDGCWQATHADIQAETRLSEHKVKAALNYLRERGWLESERASRFNPTQVWRPVWQENHVTEPRSVTVAEKSSVIVTEPRSVTPTTQTVETRDTPQPPEGELFATSLALVPSPPVQPDLFDAWWALYPRKVGKAAARKAWGKAVATASGPALYEALVIQRGALATEHARGFCPHPATWLNQGRWEDDVAAISTQNASASPYATPGALAILGISTTTYDPPAVNGPANSVIRGEVVQ